MTTTTRTLDGRTIIDGADAYAEIASYPYPNVPGPLAVSVFSCEGQSLGIYSAASESHARAIARREVGS